MPSLSATAPREPAAAKVPRAAALITSVTISRARGVTIVRRGFPSVLLPKGTRTQQLLMRQALAIISKERIVTKRVPFGEEGSDTETEVAYDFACSENLQNVVIGEITVAEKQGWDVYWIEFKQDASGSRPLTQPEFIHVERV